MSNEYRSITGGLVLCGTLFFWNYFLDWLAYQLVAKFLEPSPLLLIENGRLLRRNTRRELVTEDEIRSQLREQQIEEISLRAAGYLEPDGAISAQPFAQQKAAKSPRKKLAPGALCAYASHKTKSRFDYG